ncbi:MAG: hypothetical protein V4671_11055 [Armatimonadota bacterium]
MNSSTSWYVYCLYIAGFALVLFSESLGVSMVARPYGTNGRSWDPKAAAGTAEVLRWLGAMLLATGMVERIVGAVTSSRRSGGI